MDYRELRRLVALGVAASVRELEASLREETLGGFALCVDDDARSLVAMAASVRMLSESDDELRFVPVDWSYEDSTDELNQASAALFALADAASDKPAHVRLAFTALIDALDEARKSGVFAQSVTLLVTSTDPGETTLRLADEAVIRLNDAETQREFRRFHDTA